MTVALVIALTGCATGGRTHTLELMPAPGVYQDGSIDPFLDADVIGHGAQPEILYATDRSPAEEGDSRYEHYTNRRGHALRLGVAQVNVGHDESITWDEARRISLLKNRTDEYPLQVASVEEFGPLAQTVRPFDEGVERSAEPGARFAAEIERRLARSKSKDIFIYVHGYKVDFENSALVSSELWHFLGYQGVFIAYSWPTTAKRLAYFSDLESATVSARNLRKLIVFLSENTGV
ncbi:MAG: alpha/beta hydrolase, partial [Marinobacter sp.]|nr:alpha/beta hydrolase [Marinobacter sp.]